MYFSEENSTKEKNKSIVFSELKLSEYLVRNKRTLLSKLIFSVRSKTLNIKEWQPWQSEDDSCVACNLHIETMSHFMACASYENETYSDWNDIFGNEYEKLLKAGMAIEKRVIEREVLIENQEVG